MAPMRITWAVELLAVEPDDEILEIGCGPGVASSLVADRLTGGTITAIDRSATAIARARKRNARHLDSGRLVLQQGELTEFRPQKRFDKAFGVNVNVFWTTAADAECQVLRTILEPHGRVLLVYGGPGDTAPAVTERIVANLSRHGLRAAALPGPEPSLVCVTGRPA